MESQSPLEKSIKESGLCVGPVKPSTGCSIIIIILFFRMNIVH